MLWEILAPQDTQGADCGTNRDVRPPDLAGIPFFFFLLSLKKKQHLCPAS